MSEKAAASPPDVSVGAHLRDTGQLPGARSVCCSPTPQKRTQGDIVQGLPVILCWL